MDIGFRPASIETIRSGRGSDGRLRAVSGTRVLGEGRWNDLQSFRVRAHAVRLRACGSANARESILT